MTEPGTPQGQLPSRHRAAIPLILIALFTIVPHFVEILHQYGFLRGMSWLIKILTDPFTDLLDFYTHWVIHPKRFLDLKDHKATYRLDIKTATVHTVKSTKTN